MKGLRRVLKASALPLFMLGFVASVHGTEVSRSTEYPSPMGKYKRLNASWRASAGVVPAAAGAPANAAQATLTINGNAYFRPLDVDASRGEVDGGGNPVISSLREVVVEEFLGADGTTFTIRPLWNGTNTHWGSFGVPLATTPRYELHVNGDVIAERYRASQSTNFASNDSDHDQLLFFGVSPDGTWGEMGARRGGDIGSDGPFNDGWATGESIGRFRGQPYIVLNAYSHEPVGIGTTAPTYQLQIGDGTAALEAISHSWNNFSSREYKTGIHTLSGPEISRIGEKLNDVDFVRYRYKEETASSKPRLGVVAEEAPDEITAPDHKAVSLGNSLGFLYASIQALKKENDALEAEIRKLEGRAPVAGGRMQ